MRSQIRSIPIEDEAVLHEAAQRGKTFLRLPEDADWLERIPNVGLAHSRLTGMVKRGSLANLGHYRWLIMPLGASSVEQAAPIKALLTALLEGRADWYLGCLSALIDHGLTDVDSPSLHVVARGEVLPSKLTLGSRSVTVINRTHKDSWVGVERERAQGRVMSYRSDLERTLLDTLDYPRHCGSPEIWVRAWERATREDRVNVARIFDYSEERSNITQARLSYWLRETGHPADARRVMRSLGGPLSGARLLDSSKSFGTTQKWRRDRDTGLTVNIPQQSIDGWLSYGK
jgi:predicted transcriptional regulator of viral defense system